MIVYTDWEGRSPDLVEDQITYPISTRFIAAPKVKFVRGESMFGKSFVYVIFEDGTDIYWARSRVIEYLNSVRGIAAGRRESRHRPGRDGRGLGLRIRAGGRDRQTRSRRAALASGLASALRARIGERRGRSRAGRRLRQAIPGRSRSEQAASPTAFRSAKSSSAIQHVATATSAGRFSRSATTEYYVRGRGYIKSIADIENIVRSRSRTARPST